jgi:hypothetical protein
MFDRGDGFINGVISFDGQESQGSLDFGRDQNSMLIEQGVFENGSQDVTTGHDLAHLKGLFGFEEPLLVEIQGRHVSTKIKKVTL